MTAKNRRLFMAHNVSYCGAATCPELGANQK